MQQQLAERGGELRRSVHGATTNRHLAGGRALHSHRLLQHRFFSSFSSLVGAEEGGSRGIPELRANSLGLVRAHPGPAGDRQAAGVTLVAPAQSDPDPGGKHAPVGRFPANGLCGVSVSFLLHDRRWRKTGLRPRNSSRNVRFLPAER